MNPAAIDLDRKKCLSPQGSDTSAVFTSDFFSHILNIAGIGAGDTVACLDGENAFAKKALCARGTTIRTISTTFGYGQRRKFLRKKDKRRQIVSISVVNIQEKFGKIEQLHKYKRIARMNEIDFKLVRMKREFIWHKHPETDEAFIVIDGSLQIHLRDKTLHLEKGEMVVIPKGVEHKPASQRECKILLIEPAATVNTGDAGGVLTDDEVEWI